jgi:hypothetical protein
MSTTATYGPVLQFLYNFQAMIAGASAVAAAIVTAKVIWRAARLPVEAQARRDEGLRERQLWFTYATLGTELRALALRTKHVEATITVVVAANSTVTDATRERCYLNRHRIVEKWAFMSLLPIGLFRQISEFYRLVDDHNFDMDRAGGAFGDQNFRQSIRNRLQSIRGLATTLAAQTDDGLRETAVRT